MSADKRKTILIVFAGVAVVLVAVIAVVSPTFRSEDASGAIGAVQKYHQPQITKADVILGDESLRQEQKVLYGDFLTDAAALQNLSARVVTASRHLDAKNQFELLRKELGQRENEVYARFYDSYDLALGNAKKLAESDFALAASKKQRENLLAEIDGLAARAHARVSNIDEVSSLNGKLKDLDIALGRMCLPCAGNANVFEAMRGDVESRKFEAATQKLESAKLAAVLRNEAFYAEAMAKQAKSIGQADDALAALAARSASAQLENEAGDLTNALGVEVNDLQAAAVVNMRADLKSDTDAVQALERMSTLAAAARNRDDANLNQRAADFSMDMQNRSSKMKEQAANEMRMQYAAIRSHMRNAPQLDATLRASFAAQVNDLGKMAESRMYASMLGNEDFAAQANKLLKDVESLNASKK